MGKIIPKPKELEPYLTMKDKVVLFHFINHECLTQFRVKKVPHKMVLLVIDIDRTYPFNKDQVMVTGHFVAGTGIWTQVSSKNIISYEIYTRKMLPLLIGMKYTVPLLSELIKEG